MSCHGCVTSFGLFCRENTCENCKFSFCSKCLCMKCVVPRLGVEGRVCRECHAALVERGGEPTAEKVYAPPAAFLRRLESLEDPSRPPIVVYQHDQRMQRLKTGLEEPDRKIAERLEKLRDDMRRKSVPTEEEVARRLAALKDQPLLSPQQGDRGVQQAGTEHMQVDSLLQQYQHEHQLDCKQPDPDQEIAARLAQLRLQHPTHHALEQGQPTSVQDEASLETASLDEVTRLLMQVHTEMQAGNEGDGEGAAAQGLEETLTKLATKHSEISTVMDSEEEDVQKIVSWAMAAAKLRESKLQDVEELSDDDDMSTSSEEILPQDEQCCIICDGDATRKCAGCSGDLYCDNCFVEGHEAWDMKNHIAIEWKRRDTEGGPLLM